MEYYLTTTQKVQIHLQLEQSEIPFQDELEQKTELSEVKDAQEFCPKHEYQSQEA